MNEPAADGTSEPVRVPDHNLDDLVATVERLVNRTEAQGQMIDHLRETSQTTTPDTDAEGDTAPGPAGQGGAGDGGPESVFILALDDDAYAVELHALTAWVDHLLLPVYGREITTTRPWCAQWHEHPEAVARLHGLWLAWQQLTAVEAGLAGPSLWHRDHLDPAWQQLRAADGPFAACTTNANRPHHRLLPTPAPEPTTPGA
ncbi:DUF4913 domain-containing protein [Streptomyces sp. B1866]|uniref:DUF4913 domain-containing protein n=1 Tax=Streptomyces sp. B1866 TaxID=3075431 RepID=UPI00288E4673|nr:DUF4913 domain-containing protein [Streptomyces sp. B1866]MDT3395323.1 DUF4913 domain-containing protein [Streptomyces sp. B1866]